MPEKISCTNYGISYKCLEFSRLTGLQETALSPSVSSIRFLGEFSKVKTLICSFLMIGLLTGNMKVPQNCVSAELGQSNPCEFTAACVEWRDSDIPVQGAWCA